MTLRGNLFWFKDTLIGKNSIKKNLRSVRRYTDNGIDNYNQLAVIVNWAKQEVPFYQQYREKDFSDFPVINKKIIREQFDAFKAKVFEGLNLHSESTSGSTGIPFTIYQDNDKRIRAAADSLYFSEKAGFRLGTKLYYLRVWTKLNKKSFIQCFIKNIVMQDSSSLSDNNMELFLNKLESDESEKSILLYSNTLTALYKWMVKSKRKTSAKVKCIITMSEALPPNVKVGISNYFQCPVISRYSNQECGLISQQKGDGDEYIINTGSFFVEILNINSNDLVPDGELGRIVITDLYNKAMPLIRYDTGDLGIMTHTSKKGEKGKFLLKIEGRSNDCIYSSKGELLSPVTISVNMWKYHDLKQYQFIQTSEKSFEIKLVCDSKPYIRENELVNDIIALVGDDAKIDLIYVDNIPLLKSGKRQYVINKMR